MVFSDSFYHNFITLIFARNPPRLEVGFENGIIGRTPEKMSVRTAEMLSNFSLVLALMPPHQMGPSDGDME